MAAALIGLVVLVLSVVTFAVAMRVTWRLVALVCIVAFFFGLFLLLAGWYAWL